jgi:hypothetical protein
MLKYATYLLALLAFIVFLYTFLSTFLNSPVPSIHTIYWFLLIIVALLAPFIKGIGFKDLEIKFETESERIKKAIQDQFNSMPFGEIRTELIRGYAEYLKGIKNEADRIQAQKRLSGLYLKQYELTVPRLKSIMKDMDYFDGSINNDYDENLIEAVTKFQTDQPVLAADGVFGDRTYFLLQRKIEQLEDMEE